MSWSSAPLPHASNSPVMTVTACPPSSTRSPFNVTPHHSAARRRLKGRELGLAEPLRPVRSRAPCAPTPSRDPRPRPTRARKNARRNRTRRPTGRAVTITPRTGSLAQRGVVGRRARAGFLRNPPPPGSRRRSCRRSGPVSHPEAVQQLRRSFGRLRRSWRGNPARSIRPRRSAVSSPLRV